MVWQIEFDPAARKELDKLDQTIARRVLRFLSERLAPLDDPRGLGSPLKGARLGNLWRYRIGDYRIIADVRDDTVCILVLRIGNRRDVYKS